MKFIRHSATDCLYRARFLSAICRDLLECFDYSAYGTRSVLARAVSAGPAGSAITFRDHFTGQEDQMPDFNVPYSDHGARLYNPALRRWMTPDPLSEKYYGLSVYGYCAGNPVNFAIKREQNELAHFAEREQRKDPQGLNFVDVDGKRWVDRNGFTVWGTKGPTSFATPKQKELGVTMRKSKTGLMQLQKLINAPFDVVVEIDEYSLSSSFGKAKYYSNNLSSEKHDIEITIFQRSAWRRSVSLSGKITEMESMAVNFGHEIEHLTEKAFALDAEGAPKDEREKAPDKVSEEMTQDYLNKLEKIEPIFVNATIEFTYNSIIL